MTEIPAPNDKIGNDSRESLGEGTFGKCFKMIIKEAQWLSKNLTTCQLLKL